MIVRILGEGSTTSPTRPCPDLNELDATVEQSVETGDVDAFTSALTALLEGVRTVGVPHPTTRSTSPT